MENADIALSKKSLRQEMLAKRLSIITAKKTEYDTWICNQLLDLIIQRNAKVVHAYLPMGNEIDITPLLEELLKTGITVITPKTLPKRVLENRVLHNLQAVEKGVFGTTHPLEADIYQGHYDLAIVPGLAYDNDNYRLGYGGGYYDSFLVQHPEIFKVGICYPFQMVTKVPRENHDLQLDKIISPIK